MTRRAALTRRNPLARVGAALLFSLPLLSTLDPLTPTLAIAVSIAVAGAFGVSVAALTRRSGPLLLGAVGVLFSVVPFAEPHGQVVAAVGPLEITDGVLVDAVGLGLRVLAVALPGVIVLATMDPTDLADALTQNARLPARFAYGSLAALRLLPLLRSQWQQLVLARRSRGLSPGRNPAAQARSLGGVAFSLLVGAIRDGERLATAMDARGFDAGIARTAARQQRFTGGDWALVAGAAAFAATILMITAGLGM
ncbi:energy-coupling factor transporter transmembrane component T [Pilimelia columellifera]|uniref:Cobalt transport protein n=1 Tax=Pilimelia columellifera subsp. columellifera TaxID=706583 RepID=A0ABN3NNH2_9ACTN